MDRTGSAHWSGGVRDGKGSVSTASGALNNTPYSFVSRAENGAGTNPEELLAAAHAGCFSMALSGQLEAAGMKANSIDTKATVTLDKGEGGFVISHVHLDLTADVQNPNKAKFEEVANTAKAGCPVSKLFNTKITLDAKLANG